MVLYPKGIPVILATRSGTLLGEIGPVEKTAPRDHKILYLDLMNSAKPDLAISQKQTYRPLCRT